MAIPSRFTKVKIAAGYTLLLVVLLLSLLFVHREMENCLIRTMYRVCRRIVCAFTERER